MNSFDLLIDFVRVQCPYISTSYSLQKCLKVPTKLTGWRKGTWCPIARILPALMWNEGLNGDENDDHSDHVVSDTTPRCYTMWRLTPKSCTGSRQAPSLIMIRSSSRHHHLPLTFTIIIIISVTTDYDDDGGASWIFGSGRRDSVGGIGDQGERAGGDALLQVSVLWWSQWWSE